ncbi:MFS transporter [Massilia pseudoviolaceinigra]|uniref:MFS transporter n=1 Tax=Massilia pseudoviolaceinigra TaxID=3057165 RepID=UPI00279663DD|nr:MFS transporter [Massilia sp. CCM 9206]MDQ1922756.1 MFS transporter [Massilia sp. CCM 9206]
MSATPLPWREKISYGLADMGFNFYWANIATFLMMFYTDVYGISAASAASMMFVIKIVNAFTDPLIGAVADRTSTRFGKFRPYLVWMALPLAGAGVLTYTTPDLGENGKLAWAYGTYLLMMVCYTCINIPYNALSGVMSAEPQERSAINGLRFIFAFAGSMLVTAATPGMVGLLGAGEGMDATRRGWQLTTLAWGVLASLLFVVTFFNTRERIAPPPRQKTRVRDDIRDLAGNRPWMVLFFLALIIMVSITLRTTTAAYYFKYVVERPDLLKSFLPAYMAAAAAGAALTPLMTRFVDKKTLMMVLMSLTALFSAAFFFVDATQIGVMYALQIALGLVLGPKSPLAFSMYADTADYNEWRNGRRATAMTFAAATFSQKLGTALAVGVIGAVFTVLGYVPNAAQSGGSQAGIIWLMSVIPALFALLAVAVMFFYNLDSHKLRQIQADLMARKAPL